MAERAAYLDAVRNLAENVKGVQITSRTTFADFVTKDDEVQSHFDGWIRGARKTMVREFPDGVVEVDVEIALDWHEFTRENDVQLQAALELLLQDYED